MLWWAVGGFWTEHLVTKVLGQLTIIKDYTSPTQQQARSGNFIILLSSNRGKIQKRMVLYIYYELKL